MPFTDISADQITGGAFQDTYLIDGNFIVGDTAGRHVVIGTDIHGADGVRLYDSDGVTPLIDLTIADTPTITSAIVQTSATGKRIVLDGPNDQILLNSGTAGETDGSIVLDHVAALGSIAPRLVITTPENAGAASTLILTAGAGTIPRALSVDVDQADIALLHIDGSGGSEVMTWDGATLFNVDSIETTAGMAAVRVPDGSSNAALSDWLLGSQHWSADSNRGVVQGGSATTTFDTNFSVSNFNTGVPVLVSIVARTINGTGIIGGTFVLYFYREGADATAVVGAANTATTSTKTVSWTPTPAAGTIGVAATAVAADASSMDLTVFNNCGVEIGFTLTMVPLAAG